MTNRAQKCNRYDYSKVNDCKPRFCRECGNLLYLYTSVNERHDMCTGVQSSERWLVCGSVDKKYLPAHGSRSGFNYSAAVLRDYESDYHDAWYNIGGEHEA